MKLSERIAEGQRMAALLHQRADAIRCLAGIDESQSLIVGGGDKGTEDLHIEKGEPGYDEARAVVAGLVAAANARLAAEGIEIDLADDDAGLTVAEDEEEDDDADATGLVRA